MRSKLTSKYRNFSIKIVFAGSKFSDVNWKTPHRSVAAVVQELAVKAPSIKRRFRGFKRTRQSLYNGTATSNASEVILANKSVLVRYI